MTIRVAFWLGLLLAVFGIGCPVSAGPYSDKMSTCLVEKTTSAEKISLVRWMVVGYSRHPGVTDIVEIDETAAEANTRGIAALFSALLLDRCTAETRAALKYEGEVAMENAFRVLGDVAGRELLENPQVDKAIGEFTNHLDEDALADLFGVK